MNADLSNSSAAKGRGKQEKLDDCKGCRNKAKKGDIGLICELCNNWYHCACEDVQEEAYKLLKTTPKGIHWYCRACDRGVSTILKSLVTIEERQNKAEMEITQIKEDVEQSKKDTESLRKCLTNMEDKIKREINEHTQNQSQKLNMIEESLNAMDKKLENAIEAKLLSMKKDVSDLESKFVSKVVDIKKDVNESIEIDKRKCNIIIHGIKEGSTKTDMEIVHEVLGTGLKLDATKHTEEVHRIGIETNADKVRPIRVKITSLEGRSEILKRAKNLRESEDFKGVYISPDLTRQQQLQDKELRDKLKQYRQDGETGVKIRNGKIIKVREDGAPVILFDASKKF
jgi:phosphopantetheine adenylyltransferase